MNSRRSIAERLDWKELGWSGEGRGDLDGRTRAEETEQRGNIPRVVTNYL